MGVPVMKPEQICQVCSVAWVEKLLQEQGDSHWCHLVRGLNHVPFWLHLPPSPLLGDHGEWMYMFFCVLEMKQKYLINPKNVQAGHNELSVR